MNSNKRKNRLVETFELVFQTRALGNIGMTLTPSQGQLSICVKFLDAPLGESTTEKKVRHGKFAPSRKLGGVQVSGDQLQPDEVYEGNAISDGTSDIKAGPAASKTSAKGNRKKASPVN